MPGSLENLRNLGKTDQPVLFFWGGPKKNVWFQQGGYIFGKGCQFLDMLIPQTRILGRQKVHPEAQAAAERIQAAFHGRMVREQQVQIP